MHLQQQLREEDRQQQQQQHVSCGAVQSLHAAAMVLLTTAQKVLVDLAMEQQHSSDGTFVHPGSSSAHELEVVTITPGYAPPPAVAGASCVYVLRTADGWFYCGSSDDVKRRLAQHRQPKGKGGHQVRQGRVFKCGSRHGYMLITARALQKTSLSRVFADGGLLCSCGQGRRCIVGCTRYRGLHHSSTRCCGLSAELIS